MGEGGGGGVSRWFLESETNSTCREFVFSSRNKVKTLLGGEGVGTFGDGGGMGGEFPSAIFGARNQFEIRLTNGRVWLYTP